MNGKVFFCYARKDQDFAVRLAENLKKAGVPIWLDQWDIHAEADWDRSIDQALRECERMLIVLSPASVDSREVRGELRSALDLHKPILPVLYQPCEIPRQLRIVQFVDFSGRSADYPAALNKLVSVCLAEARVPDPRPVPVRRKLGVRGMALAAAVVALLWAGWFAARRGSEEHRRMNYAALSPDGSYLAAAVGQGLGIGGVHVWDVSSGRQLSRLTTSNGPFWVVDWSPDGSKLAAGDHEGTLRIYKAGTWNLLAALEGPRSPAKFIAWSGDGGRVAAGDDTGTLFAWDVATGKALFRSQPHSGLIAAAAWSPDGSHIATASWDKTGAVEDARNGRVLARLEGHNSHVNAVAWSPDGKWVATGSLENPLAMVFEASGHGRILEGPRSAVDSIGWSSDGRYLAGASSDGAVRFWDGARFEPIEALRLQGSHLAWSPGGDIASSDAAGVYFLGLRDEPVVRKLTGFPKREFFDVLIAGWADHGTRLAAYRTDDGAKVWETKTGKVVGSFRVGFMQALME